MNKKETILQFALEAFAANGFLGTSTSSIAKKAGVSEALIFRHYESKEGLLSAIFAQGYSFAEKHRERITQLSSPQEKMHALLELPLVMIQENPDYRKLSCAIKFQHLDLYKKLRPYDIDSVMMKEVQIWLDALGKDMKQSNIELLNLLTYFEGIVQLSIKQPDMNLMPLVEERKAKY